MAGREVEIAAVVLLCDAILQDDRGGTAIDRGGAVAVLDDLIARAGDWRA